MKLTHLGITAIVAAAATCAGLLVMRAVAPMHASIGYIAGAIVASWVGFSLGHRAGVRRFTNGVTAQLAAAITAANVATGLALELTLGVSQLPWISLPFAAIGSFFFPFVLRSTIVGALAMGDRRPPPPQP